MKKIILSASQIGLRGNIMQKREQKEAGEPTRRGETLWLLITVYEITM